MNELRRTQLATPASDRGMMANAAKSEADEVFLDLEDSVAPSGKAEARELLIEAAREENWDGTISFWLRLEPNRDLRPGYSDPLLVTPRAWNDASFFTDFTKMKRPLITGLDGIPVVPP